MTKCWQEKETKERLLFQTKKCEVNDKIKEVKCFKNGRTITKTVMSKDQSTAIMNKIRNLTNKDNCFDVFYNTRVKDARVYPEKPIQSLI